MLIEKHNDVPLSYAMYIVSVLQSFIKLHMSSRVGIPYCMHTNKIRILVLMFWCRRTPKADTKFGPKIVSLRKSSLYMYMYM